MDILSTKEAAQLTGLSKATFRYWRHKGVGPASFTLGGKPGSRGRVVYRLEEVTRWIAEQETATAGAHSPRSRCRLKLSSA